MRFTVFTLVLIFILPACSSAQAAGTAETVTIVAEPVSSAPPLYLGKPLVPIEGSVRMVALADMRTPQGKLIDPRTLSYAWTVDGTKILRSSGIGKEVLIVASPLEYRSRAVTVTVTNQEGTASGSADISFVANKPSVRLYRNDPLLGVLYDKALSGGYTISSAEESFFGAPFSFPLSGGAPRLEWFLNGTEAQQGATVTLRPSGEGVGRASLSLVASSNKSAKATEILSLSFGDKETGFNLFGL